MPITADNLTSSMLKRLPDNLFSGAYSDEEVEGTLLGLNPEWPFEARSRKEAEALARLCIEDIVGMDNESPFFGALVRGPALSLLSSRTLATLLVRHPLSEGFYFSGEERYQLVIAELARRDPIQSPPQKYNLPGVR